MDYFGFSPRFLRAFQAFFQEDVRVPIFSGATVDGYHFHTLYSPILFPYFSMVYRSYGFAGTFVYTAVTHCTIMLMRNTPVFVRQIIHWTARNTNEAFGTGPCYFN